MPALIEAARLDHLAPGKGAVVTAGDSTVALFKTDAAIYALEAWCLRCGACLAEGNLEGWTVACYNCDWRYDVATGSVVGIPALQLQIFSVEVIDGQIVISNA